MTFTKKSTKITDQYKDIKSYGRKRSNILVLFSTITWAPTINARVVLAYPALKWLYPLIAPNSKLKKDIKITVYKTCVRPIVTYGHQIWATAPRTYILKTQRTQNIFLRIIFNGPRDTKTTTSLKLAKILTIKQFIYESVSRTYNHTHTNLLISNTGKYDINEIPLKIKIRLPKHATQWLLLQAKLQLLYSR